MRLRRAAELLLVEAAAIKPILESAAAADFDLPTVCDGWSVRDVVAHCAAALTQTADGANHRFTPEDNQRDVDERRGRQIADVVAELLAGYEAAAGAIDAAGGVLDGVGLGEWMHGGDIREALGLPGAYASEGVELAVGLLVERSEQLQKRAVTVRLPHETLAFGVGEPSGVLTTDVETFIRLCGGRVPDPDRFELNGDVEAAELVLFS